MASTRTIAIVVGTRPNFVKLRPLRLAFEAHPGLQPVVIHTGQHHDDALYGRFFRELRMAAPDVILETAPGTRSQQLGNMILRLEPVLNRVKPSWVVVIGDVTSTLAGALTGRQLGIPVAHVEAGLRNGCPVMAEELNRRLTDAICQLHFATEPSAVANLRAEGISEERIRLVGNVLVDALHLAIAEAPEGLNGGDEPLGIVTLHRPENVEDPERLRRLLKLIAHAAKRVPLLFPVHPRTRAALGRLEGPHPLRNASVTCVGPMGYLEMIARLKTAPLVLTDSGGLQEETTALGIPCITLRPSTERPATVELGSNWVVDDCADRLEQALTTILHPQRDEASERRPPMWDGRSAPRIAEALAKWTPVAEGLRW